MKSNLFYQFADTSAYKFFWVFGLAVMIEFFFGEAVLEEAGEKPLNSF